MRYGGQLVPCSSGVFISLKFGQSIRGDKSPFPIQEGSQLFIRVHNEPLTVVAMCVNSPERSLFGIHG
jgi:hypothetical protein